jgi:drug/metabolite transporter (DMT)-like permease
MSPAVAYLALILIWATTPLGVQWSNDSLSPLAAVLSRMVLAWILVAPLCFVMRTGALNLKQNWRLYAAASLGLFPNMPLVNTAAHYIPSGLIALIFGMSPFIVALLSWWILDEEYMNPRRYLALAVSLAGLGILFREHMQADAMALKGIALMLVSITLFSISAVLVKRYHTRVHSLTQVSGSLLFAFPGLALSWWVMDGVWPAHLSERSAWSVVYLSSVGSVVGYLIYFYLLRVMAASAVSAVALVSPMLAVWIGVWLNHEPMSGGILLGTALVLGGLWIFSGLFLGSSGLAKEGKY